MKRLPKDDVQKMVSSIINKVPNNYRCYEITRTFKAEFFKKGFNFEVRDGYAFYCFNTFLKEAYMKNCELFFGNADKNDELIKIVRVATSLAVRNPSLERNLYWRIGIRHSWAILPEEKYLIDCHRSISPNLSSFPILQRFPILRKISVEDILIINQFKKVPKYKGYFCGDIFYWEEAFQKGNSIYYPDTNYSTELRM